MIRAKRLFDLWITVPILLILAPLLLVIAVIVRFKLGNPIFFAQIRPGLHGKPFKILKFRTMIDARDSQGNLLPDADRLTNFGRILRSTSMDELPELINVLKGEMSLIGPRPLAMEYLPYYSKEENTRHSVRPGITGWAQVNGRNRLSWDERLGLDIMYTQNNNLQVDLKIILMTIKNVILRTDVVADPRSIMKDLDEERRERRED